MARVPPQALNTALLQSLDAWLGALPPSDLKALNGPGDVLTVITAAPLDAEAQVTCGQMLAHHFATLVSLRFDSDQSLLAGVELSNAHVRLRNSWQADLDRITQELGRDDEQRAVA